MPANRASRSLSTAWNRPAANLDLLIDQRAIGIEHRLKQRWCLLLEQCVELAQFAAPRQGKRRLDDVAHQTQRIGRSNLSTSACCSAVSSPVR